VASIGSSCTPYHVVVVVAVAAAAHVVGVTHDVVPQVRIKKQNLEPVYLDLHASAEYNSTNMY